MSELNSEPTSNISPARIKANHKNATRSTGPRTKEGKARISLNGLSHGLTGQTVLMPYEDREQYEAFIAETIAGFEAESDTELQLVAEVADDQWRLKRARAIEEGMFASGLEGDDPVTAAFNQARAFLDGIDEIALLNLYATRIRRNIDKNLAEFDSLRAERKAARERALKQALHLAQIAESEGLHYRPVDNGFGFSTVEITRLLARERLLKRARALLYPAQISRRKPKNDAA
jgi:hypothetical protein